MKKLRLKPVVKYVGLGSVLCVSLITVSLFAKEEVKTVNKNNDSFVYVNDYIFDNYYPVVKQENKIIRPYSSENVTVYKSFYDKDASEEEQQNSLVFHEGIYMQNSGVDYKSDETFEVLSVMSGTVVNVTEDTLLGKTIEIRHSNELVSTYQSLGEVSVKKGDTITQGQVIGKSGSCQLYSDVANGLHFEIYQNGSVINPEKSYDKNIKDLASKQ